MGKGTGKMDVPEAKRNHQDDFDGLAMRFVSSASTSADARSSASDAAIEVS